MWENTGLDKRIAITFLRLIGSSLRIQLVFWFVLSAVLSAVLPNAVVCATITPIAIAMLKYIGMDDIKTNKTASDTSHDSICNRTRWSGIAARRCDESCDGRIYTADNRRGVHVLFMGRKIPAYHAHTCACKYPVHDP